MKTKIHDTARAFGMSIVPTRAKERYYVVVIGGSPAGLVVASRLPENPTYSLSHRKWELACKPTHTTMASEVLVPKGATNTPRRLLLPGVVPKKHLAEVGGTSRTNRSRPSCPTPHRFADNDEGEEAETGRAYEAADSQSPSFLSGTLSPVPGSQSPGPGPRPSPLPRPASPPPIEKNQVGNQQSRQRKREQHPWQQPVSVGAWQAVRAPAQYHPCFRAVGKSLR